jgi:hypothetical protein
VLNKCNVVLCNAGANESSDIGVLQVAQALEPLETDLNLILDLCCPLRSKLRAEEIVFKVLKLLG